jgi:hypothetical protein
MLQKILQKVNICKTRMRNNCYCNFVSSIFTTPEHYDITHSPEGYTLLTLTRWTPSLIIFYLKINIVFKDIEIKVTDSIFYS